MTNGSSPVPLRRDIQGLRAVAVLAVVAYHASIPFITGGYVGVDVFFVISGFLITSHLLHRFDRDGRIDLAAFYAQRARRILPAAFVVLSLSVVAAMLWLPPLEARSALKDALATALYVPNVLFAAEGTNYLSEYTPSIFQHYWSLGVEEQFYLLWPLVLLIGLRRLTSRKLITLGLSILLVASFTLCVAVSFKAPSWAFFSLPTRAWELGVGAIVALLLTYGVAARPKAASVFGWMGLAGIGISIVIFDDETFFPGYAVALPVISVAIVIWSGATPSRRGPLAVLGTRILVFIGTISYSLYLVHWPALVIPQSVVTYFRPLPIPLTAAIAILCVPLAWVLYRFVESPIRHARHLVDAHPRRSLAFAGMSTVTAVTLALTCLAVVSERPLSTPDASPQSRITKPPTFTSFVPIDLEPSLIEVQSDNAEIFSTGCHLGFAQTDPRGCTYNTSGPIMALFGDSHAAQWFSGLLSVARAKGLRLEIHTKSSCPSAFVRTSRAGAPYTACDEWRSNVIEYLRNRPPALVVLSNYGANIDSSGDSGAAWAAGITRTMEALRGVAPIAVIADTPDLRQTPSICLSGHLDSTTDCSRTREFALSAPSRSPEAEAVRRFGAYPIDLTDYMCNESTCSPINGRTLMYRDAQHITDTFSERLGPALGAQLGPLLASAAVAGSPS